MTRFTFGLVLTYVVSIFMVVGCGDGGAAVAQRRGNLHALGMAYHSFYADERKSPANAAELADFMRSAAISDQQDLDAIKSLEEGDIVMNWNAVLDDSEENGKYVLGFEAGVPATGGYVVMGDGFVELMTVKDYSEATMIPNATESATEQP